jgi:hypothetical protein
MWEFVTSVTIIILVTAYILHDRLKLRYEKIEDDTEKEAKLAKLGMRTRIIIGVLAFFGGIGWIIYMETHTIYISPELEGFHNLVPAIIMSVIGLIVFGGGFKKYLQSGK